MCQSFRKACQCGEKTAEIFFGRNILDEKCVTGVFCPLCSRGIETKGKNRVWDNGWILELDLEILRAHALTMEIPPQEISAERVFDRGFATWIGITPDDSRQRDREREGIQKLAPIDLRAYLEAMRVWGITRERRHTEEGWRKMKFSGR